MAQIEIKSKDGKVVGKHDVSPAIASAQPIMAVLHRAVVAEEANSRQGTQCAKTRSEVRGGGRKPYKQKKTGNARQGTIRAPHYAHGGMALAVKPRSYDKKINRKEKRAALLGALNAKVTAGDVTVVDKIVFAEAKTKAAADFVKAMNLSDTRRLLVVLPEYDETTYKCFRNIPNVTVRTAPVKQVSAGEPAKVYGRKAEKNVAESKPKSSKKVASADKAATFSTRDLLVAHKILIAQDALKRIEEVWAK